MYEMQKERDVLSSKYITYSLNTQGLLPLSYKISDSPYLKRLKIYGIIPSLFAKKGI